MFIDPDKIPPTGHPRIDAGHRALAREVNELYGLWRSGASREDLRTGFKLLLRSVGRHFAEEEEAALGANFAGLEHHRARHRALLERLSEAVAALPVEGDGTADPVIDLFEAMDTLLYEHEVLDDQEYWPLFRDGLAAVEGPGPLIIWTPDLETGLAQADQHHRGLALQLNHIKAAVCAKAPARRVTELLEGLKALAVLHFAWEEVLMMDADVPSIEDHRLLHRRLLDDLDTLIARWADGGFTELEAVLESDLKFWLIDHIRHVDQPMAEGILARRAAAADEDDISLAG